MSKLTGQATFLLSLLLLLVSYAMFVNAEDEEESESGGDPVAVTRPIYIPLKPPLVVNYGGRGRLKYLKTDISIRVTGRPVAKAIQHHMPLIRNNLVLLFSRQKDEDIDTQEGKELLHQAALEEIRVVIGAEEGITDGVVDLYFNNFVIQK